MVEYKNGYVAFVDILGFSNLIMKEENYYGSKKLFDFVENICEFYNSNGLDVKLAFFSDTIIITSDSCNLVEIALTIRILESYLWDNLKLVFRGSVVKGLFYNENGIAFGPAIIDAYELEKKANTARIIVDNNILDKNLIINDIDGEHILNIEYLTIFEKCFDYCKAKMLFETVFDTFQDRRNVIDKMLSEYKNTPVEYKYAPKKYMFNYIINDICESNGENINLTLKTSEKSALKGLLI